MVDHEERLLFGYFLTPNADSYNDLLRQVQLADELGLDLIGIQDHPYQSRFFDTWTLMSALAPQTRHIRFFTDVANLPLRPPAMLAKAVASLDQITGGRVELGLGAGAFWDGVAAMGGPRREPGEAVMALEEAVQVIRAIWSGQRGIRFDGQYYQLKGTHAGPQPAHAVGIWIGAIHARMLALTGQLGDGWIPSSSYVPPEQLLEKNRQIDQAAQQAGRNPSEIKRLYNVMGRIVDGVSAGPFDGPVSQWVDDITRLVLDQGMDGFIFAPSEPSEEQIRLFAEEVMPQVREQAHGG